MFWIVLVLVALLVPPAVLGTVLVRRRRWLLLTGMGALLAVALSISMAFAGLAGENPDSADGPASLRWRMALSAALFLFAANVPIVLGLLSLAGGGGRRVV